MRINKKTRPKKAPVIVGVIVVLIIAAGATFMIWHNNRSDTPANTNNTQTTNTADADDENIDGNINDTNSDSITNESNVTDQTPVQYEGQNANDAPAYNNEQFRIPEGEQ